MDTLKIIALPCMDSDTQASFTRQQLDIPRSDARDLGRSAVECCDQGYYLNAQSERIEIESFVEAAVAATVSIRPEGQLPNEPAQIVPETRIQVSNETTLAAGQRLISQGLKPLALNFANGLVPGGGFLNGARAQEEVLCRSSALFSTLANDPMYDAHANRSRPDSTEWAIYSPDVPVFRGDDGTPLDKPWPLSFITCAAPVAYSIGANEAAELLTPRIHRVLAIARAYGYQTLILGAWGCGAFGNDPFLTATDFEKALLGEFRGCFSNVVFAITDWSEERRYLGPFRDVFATHSR